MSKILEEGECSESSSSEDELAGCYLTSRLNSFGKTGKEDFLVKTEATDNSNEIPNDDETFGHQEKQQQQKKKSQEHRQREVSREQQSTLIKQIADVLVMMKELYNLLKKQDQFERRVLEVETDWYFKSINSEYNNVTQADKIDWILLNGDLEEVKSKRTRVENELAAQNLEDILKSSDNTWEHRRLKYMLDLVGSIEKRTTSMSRERKNLHSKVRKIKSDKKNINLFGQVVKKCNEIDEQSSEYAQFFPNCGKKRVAPGSPSASAENTLPLLKKIKTEKEDPFAACPLKNLKIEKEESLIVETVAELVTEPTAECKVEPIAEPSPETKAGSEIEHKLGPYWTYVASIIQCLKSTRYIKEYLVKNGYFPSISGTYHTAQVLAQNEKTEKLAGHLKAIWSGKPSASISRNDTDVVVEHYNLSSTTFQQRDAHKFLLFLLNALHNDLAQLMENDDGEFVTNREMAWRKALDNRSSIISDTFYGQFRITTKCSTCATMHATYETFKTITLPLTRTKSCILIRCLERFFTPTNISGWNCPKCCVGRKAKRTIEIIKVPPIVIFHLDRFSGCMGFGEKNNVMINYPLRELNLGPYVAFGLDSSNSPSRPNVYTFQLYAVTCYDETVSGGRYTACCDCRTQLEERIWCWHGKGKCNMVETKWIENHGSKVQSYLLFYEALISHIPDSR